MATVDGDGNMVDVKLFKIIGLYQILRPAPQDGRTGRKYQKTLMAVMWLMLMTYIIQISALYFAMNDFQRLAHQTLVLSVCVVTWIKGYLLIWNADRMWPVLELGRYAFTSSGHRDPSKLIQCHATLSTMVRLFAAFYYWVLVAWLASPFFIHEPTKIIHLDGTVSKHRMTVLNLWMPLSEAEYNSTKYWAVVYGIEVMTCTINVFIWTMFDCYIMTVCFVLEAQFRTLEIAYTEIGHRQPWDDSTVPAADDYGRLISHIKDNQKIVRWEVRGIFHHHTTGGPNPNSYGFDIRDSTDILLFASKSNSL
ncbi:Olfactory receptor, insect [Cinara cedri]|uniref:Olfactory receptor, insect n=1 Tax=Cinara cedri TaxID=506608 RepID=A0A5E4M6Z8_9HEMI|nr:Olfactory receptor, insect [Cinara cedri]